MGIKKHILLFSMFFIFSQSISIAQDLDSNHYKLHTVLKGETSYGIAKKYQIKLNDFFSVNPDAIKGFK